jgi:hypothetical protein
MRRSLAIVRAGEAAWRCSSSAVLIACATAWAQGPERGVSFEADSAYLDLRSGGSVFKGLAVTDGVISVVAAEGTTTSEGDDAVWHFRAGLSITIDVTTVTADSGTFRYVDGRFTEFELLGAPLTLDGSTRTGSRPFRLTGRRISYDGARQLFTASEGVVFASNGMEIRNCSWTYDLAHKSVQGLAEGERKCTADVVVNRPSVP